MSTPQQEPLSFQRIPLELLDISEANVRQQQRFEDIDELAKNMAAIGLQQPIVVQPKNGRFEILIGQRRFRAAKELGWTHIDAKIEPIRRSSLEATVISFSENIQRCDLSPDDKSAACLYLFRQLGGVAKVAERLSITEQTVRKWLGYAVVPQRLKSMVSARQISVPTATRLWQLLSDEDKAVAIAERMVQEKAPARQRSRIMAAVQEAPDRPLGAIFRRASEMQFERRITVILPEQSALALDRAAKLLQLSPSDVARDALIEWLEIARY